MLCYIEDIFCCPIHVALLEVRKKGDIKHNASQYFTRLYTLRACSVGMKERIIFLQY